MRNEKQALEYAACEYFLKSYNSCQRTNLIILDHNDKPDFIIKDKDTAEVIGLEVSHLFYDQEEAKMLLGRSSNKTHDPMNMGNMICELNNLLAEKATASLKYLFQGRLFLLIRVASPLFGKPDFELYEDEISIS